MIRRTARVLGVSALVAPALVALTAGSASAAQSISSPADGTVYSSGQTVTVSGSFSGCTGTLNNNCPTGTLTVTDPSGASVASTSKKASGTSTQSISTSVTLSSTNKNGGYRVTLTSGGTTSTSHFYTNMAPATPSGFDATTTDGDAHDVLLSWSKGTEPDLQGYTVYDGSGNVIQDGISAKSACSGSSCTYSLYYDNPSPGTYNYSYTLTSTRSGGCASGTCPTLESSKTGSRSASLTTPVPPPPSPTPQPSSGGAGGTTGGTSSGGSTGGTSTGGGSSNGSSSSGGSTRGATGATTSASPIPLPTLDPGVQARALALNFSNFSAGLGIPKLPPLPKTDVVLPSGEGAIPQGTYNPQLPYSSKSETVHSRALASDPIGYVSSVDWKKVATPLAWALILVLSAAHLRRWIGAHVED